MKYLIALTLSLIASQSLSFDGYVKCKQVASVTWQLEAAYGFPAGFTERSIEENEMMATFDHQLLSFYQLGGYPVIFDLEKIDTFSTRLPGEVPIITLARYKQRKGHLARNIQVFVKDPMCRENPNSTLSWVLTGVSNFMNNTYECECLDSNHQDKFIDD